MQAEPESEEMIICGFQNMMAHDAVKKAHEMLSIWTMYIAEVHSKYRRPSRPLPAPMSARQVQSVQGDEDR